MRLPAKERRYLCPVDAVVQLIGGKYKPSILWHLAHDGTMRFGALRRVVPATAKMLTQQLRGLEMDGLLHREVYPVVPPRTEYSLTAFGRTLIPVLDAMCAWGREHCGGQIEEGHA